MASCSRYVASSLVLQGIDGISTETIWRLHDGALVPDLGVLLHADAAVLHARLDERGRHSRFENRTDSSRIETDCYTVIAAELRQRGWPLLEVSCSTYTPESVALIIALHVLPIYQKRNQPCPI